MKSSRRSRTVGYIVAEPRSPLIQSQDDVLWIPGGAHPRTTLFPTRAVAQAAIDRTRLYAIRYGLHWADTRHQIFRVVASPEGET